jgi:short subunit dehydrogenase-like uncharacterized protein
MGDIVVLGATGYTGRLAIASLVRRGLSPILVGRRLEPLETVAAEHGGLRSAVADLAHPGSLRELLRAGDVLITTVGPFERLGHVAARAAAESGAHYVDSTGEVGFVRELRHRYDEVARETGATMLPAFGYDFVPGFLAGSLAASRAGAAATTLRIGYFSIGSLRRGLSAGTRATLGDGVLRPAVVRHDHHLVEARPASRTHRFPVRGRVLSGFLSSGTEALFLPDAHPHLADIEVYNGWFPNLSRPMVVGAAVAGAVASTDPGRRIVEAVARSSAARTRNPDAAERARTRTHVVATAHDDRGRVLAESHVEGPSIYDLTGELLALAADELQSQRARAVGVTDPLTAFGGGALAPLAATIGLVEIPARPRGVSRDTGDPSRP